MATYAKRSSVLAATVSLIGLAGAVGWAIDVPALTRIAPGLATMKFNTAFGFTLSGVVLGLVALQTAATPSPRALRVFTGAGGLAVFMLGAFTLSQDLGGWDFGIAQLAVTDPALGPGAALGGAPGRMSPSTSLGFMLVGAALVALHVGRTLVAQWFALGTALVAGIALTGYLYGLTQLYDLVAFTSMAVHTALAFLLLAAGIMVARPDEGIVAAFVGDRPGSLLARRLWLPLVAVVVVVGGLVEWGERRGLVGSHIDTALLVVSVLLIVSALFWLGAQSLNRAHERLVHLNELYEVRSQCNQLIVHARDEHTLFGGVRQILVETGGFESAWVGFVGEGGEVAPAEQNASSPVGGPPDVALAERAVRADQRIFDTPTAHRPGHLLKSAPPGATVAAFPVRVGGDISDGPAGALVVRAAKADAFGGGVADLLDAVASDLSFALRQMALARRHEATERRFYRAITEAPFPILLHTEDGQILHVSRTFTELTGYTHDDVPTIDAWTERAYGEQKQAVRVDIDRLYALNHRVDEGEYTVRTQNGDQRSWVFSSAPLGPDADGRRLVVSMAADVTARKRAELEARRMSARLVQAGEQERRHIARELHDELGGLLTSLHMSLKMTPAPTPAARAELDESLALVKTIVGKVRELSLDLRPSLLDDLGLRPALRQLVDRFSAQTRVAVDFHCEVDREERFSSEVETTAYRIVQEALTNVARHAGVDRVQVLCHREPGRLVLHVVDAGRGFDAGHIEESASTGLSAMRERAALVGGTLELSSAPGVGTRVTASLPL